MSDIIDRLLSSYYNSNLSIYVTIFSSVIYTLYNINMMITNENYIKRPLLCYMSTFSLTCITSPYIGGAIGYFAPISFPIILGINHYPLIKKKIKDATKAKVEKETEEPK